MRLTLEETPREGFFPFGGRLLGGANLKAGLRGLRAGRLHRITARQPRDAEGTVRANL
jgi:hypothetical protein